MQRLRMRHGFGCRYGCMAAVLWASALASICSAGASAPSGGGGAQAESVLTVIDSNGAPVEGAQVYWVTQREPLLLNEELIRTKKRGHPVPETDAQGKAVLSRPQSELYLLMVAHPDHGYADAVADANAPVKQLNLAPWGRVEGLVTMNGDPSEGVHLKLTQWSGIMPAYQASYEAVTDRDGRFAVRRAKPGVYQVSRAIEQFSRFGFEPGILPLYVPCGTVEVRPGERATCNLEEPVLEVKGTVQWHDSEKVNAHEVMVNLTEVAGSSQPVLPDHLLGLQGEERAQALREFKLTDAGRAHCEAASAASARAFSVGGHITDERQFNIRGVQPGEYLLTAYGGSSSKLFSDAVRIRVDARQGVTDVGELKMLPPGSVQPGSPIPALQLTSLDGAEKIDIEKYRGRYVLLAGWGMDCPPCLAGIPELVQLHDRMDHRADFAMLSITTDPPEDARPQRHVQRLGLQWPQARAELNSYVRKLGSQGIPDYIVVDPNGTVMARDHDLTKIIALIDEALGQ